MSVKTRANKQTGATIKDVAQHAGVSAMTVSRVLNAEPNVREETRERVQAAIRELNYRPNLSARSLARLARLAADLSAARRAADPEARRARETRP